MTVPRPSTGTSPTGSRSAFARRRPCDRARDDRPSGDERQVIDASGYDAAIEDRGDRVVVSG
jgi:hypothetical protein